jgi:glycosyltransferase involved in cell wall biosynthesis
VVRLLFFGQLDYPPNVDAMRYFASDIFPAFQSTGVPFHVTIVGSGQGIAVREILQGLTGVEIVGRVPDVTQAIVAADAVIVPLRAGGGTRLKILEAMATGRLVVSTSVGSEGIEAKHDVHLWTANTPTDFAAALTALARDPAPMFAIARAGADFVRGTYSWSAIQERLRGVISTSPIEPPLHEQASVASASTAGSIASVP